MGRCFLRTQFVRIQKEKKNLPFFQMFKKVKMVTIVRVTKPRTDEIVGFHPNVNTLIPNLDNVILIL